MKRQIEDALTSKTEDGVPRIQRAIENLADSNPVEFLKLAAAVTPNRVPHAIESILA